MRALSAGAYVAPGQKLATIIPQGDLLIVADFDPTTALGRIRPGQTARFRLEGFPWVQFGTIEATAVRVAGEIRDQSLRAEFRIRRDATRGLVLRHGLPGQDRGQGRDGVAGQAAAEVGRTDDGGLRSPGPARAR